MSNNSTESNISDKSNNNDSGNCRLLDNWALIVQGCMGMIAISILLLKRYQEHPKRPFKIWILDVSKQVIGQVMVHCMNIALSYIRIFDTSTKVTNPCVWYFLNLFLDTTLGIFLIMFYMYIMSKIVKLLRISHCETGYYGDNPEKPLKSAWIKQTIIFLICLCSMKLSVIAIITKIPIFMKFGRFVISMVSKNVRVQVAFDMLILPLTMNAIQFWFVDKIIKSDEQPKYHFELVDGISLDLENDEFSDVNRLLN